MDMGSTAAQQYPPKSNQIVVIGAGIIGLTNALQLAKRGLSVTLIDNLQARRHSFKVGESFLVFTSAFLRTIGELDTFITERSFIKLGVWFSAGAEYRHDFGETTEWAVNADPHPPHYLYDLAPDKKWFRCMFLDMQIVRPEAEAVMLKAVREHPNITLIDNVRIRKVVLAEDDGPHLMHWQGQGCEGTSDARWLVDCSGRSRLLARQQGHTAEKHEERDGFQTTAIWGQFEHAGDAVFDARWRYLLQDGRSTPRDLYTVHLWGRGYWIWVIRLSQDRISVGVTFDQRTPPEGATPAEKFWNLIRRYPLLDGIINEQTLLELQTFRNVQHWTDTFVSPRRYAMAGDSASIIDAYYSQGMALGMVTSWHIANVVQRDLLDQHLDRGYIKRINHATRQDWHMLRNMVHQKYSPAIEDSRFFLLSHMLDMAVFWCMGSTRSALTHWLVQTEGQSSRETAQLRRLRQRLESRLFYSRSPYWLWLSPERVQRLQAHLQRQLARRARWRQDNGIRLPRVTSFLSLTAPLPRVWKLFGGAKAGHIDVSARDLVQPAEQRPAGSATWFDRLPISPMTRLGWVIRLRPLGLLLQFALCYAWDAAETRIRRGWRDANRVHAAVNDVTSPQQDAR
ncbi:FAD-dependent oxidoreductase [Xanthomonas oryzae pv. oryzicola]|nr:FAD-dependent oxidoreductase [Xanthomonas oryzae pv. oryzicola]